MELEDERKSREALEQCLKEQQIKIESLRKLSVSMDQADISSQEKGDSWSTCEELSDGNCSMMLQGDAFRTPNFKAIPNDFVVKQTSCSRALDLSPIPDNFASVADEDLWLQLNKGCTTNLDMLQMTPNLKQNSLSSADTTLGLTFQEGVSNERSHSVVSESGKNNPELNAVKERCTALEGECNLLREEKASLVQSLSISQQDVELLRTEKEGLLKDLNIEKQKMKDVKEEIRLFSLAFAQREGLLTSLYTKSKAMMENLKSSRAPVAISELCDY